MTSKRGKPDFLELVKSDRQRPAELPHLLGQVQQAVVTQCERLLDGLFAATDDAFYELSSKAGSNNEESLYFDSMRKVRIARQGITRAFGHNVAASFTTVAKPGATQEAVTESISAKTLSLLDGDELEIDLALKNMVTRSRDLFREPLYELNVRFLHLLRTVEVTEDNNPLDPRQISLAFIDACTSALAADIKIRLILFKLFEKHVLKNLAPVYAQANQMLADAGVVPKVARQLRKDQQAVTPEQLSEHHSEPHPEQHSQQQWDRPVEPAPRRPTLSSEQAQGASHFPRFNVSLESLVTLMAAARGAAQPAVGSQAAPVVNCFIFASNNPGPVMTAPQLTGLLSRAQLLADRRLAKSPRNIVPEVVESLLRKTDAQTPQALNEADESVINLVSLFFDQILADDNLPVAVYALICRLQIPILKIALQDASFFSHCDHPARELINTITEVGIGFDEHRPLERDPIYRMVADVVQTISREYQITAQLFEDLHDALRATIRTEQRKINIVERRTSQCAAGRSRIRQAKKNSQNLLYSRLRGVQLPSAVSEFLTTAWLQVLIITQLKHGHGSTEWTENVECATDLVWLCQPHQDVRSLLRREQLQPRLMQRIEAGLEAAIESHEVRNLKVRDLQAALRQINIESETVTYCGLSQKQLEALGQRQADEQQPSPARVALRDLSPDCLKLARQLPEGSWVEFQDEQTGEKWRYRLASKADTEAYIFVNRMGFKTLERSCRQLAHDFQCKKLKALDCGEFFDRMMNKVLSRIGEAA